MARKNVMGFSGSKSALGKGRVKPPHKMAHPRGSVSKIRGAAKIKGGKSHGRNY